MKIRQLEYVYSVVKYKTMHKAAEKLFVTQPTISQQIKNLEQSIGFSIFKKEGRKLVLTKQGEKILPYIEKIVTSVINFEHAVEDVKSPSSGEIAFGLKPVFSHEPIRNLLNEFNDLYPKVTVNILESGSIELLNLVEQEQLDSAIINTNDELRYYMEKNKIRYHTLSKSKFVLVIPINHPLGTMEKISYKDIENESIMLYRGGLIENYVTQLFGDKYKKNIILSFVDYISITNLVRDGFGISIIPEAHVQHWSDEQRKGLTFLEFIDFGQTIEICLARKDKGFIPEYLKDFNQLILRLNESVV